MSQHVSRLVVVHRVASQCREAGLSNEHEGDQADVSSPDQVKDRMTERLDSEGRHVQEPLGEPRYVA